MREGVEQGEMKEEDVEEDEEELMEEGGERGAEKFRRREGWEWEWSRRWQQCTASEGWRLLYSSQHSSSLGQCTNMLNERLMKKWTVYCPV